MQEKGSLYFIALIPQKAVCDEITNLKEDFAARFDSRKALRIMPHITIKAPFRLAAIEHSALVTWFQNFATAQSPFEIQLKDFGSFPDSERPVIFVQPVMNDALLILQKDIIGGFANLFPDLVHPTDLNFKPHITIAYRDLSFENYKQAWREYRHKKYQAAFEVQDIHLLEHDSMQWNIIATYKLN